MDGEAQRNKAKREGERGGCVRGCYSSRLLKKRRERNEWDRDSALAEGNESEG